MGSTLEIRAAAETDFEQIYEIFLRVLAPGDTFPYRPDTSREDAFKILMDENYRKFVGLDSEGRVVGFYLLRPNWPGRGSHVATGTYMVDPQVRGQGIGKLLGLHSFAQARDMGCTAMQFNYVVSTNETAVRLWRQIGMKIVGTVPGNFMHATLGPVDTYVMHRYLE